MKLKTKFQDEDFDLGEVVEANVYHGGNGRIKVIAEAAKGGDHTFYFETLKGMNEMFEDYEEPKEYWYIDWTPEIGAYHTRDTGSDADERQKEIGNYFETKEEAELAVRKLQAWKRLKDKGFRFTGWYSSGDTTNTIRIYAEFPDSELGPIVGSDLDLLFQEVKDEA